MVVYEKEKEKVMRVEFSGDVSFSKKWDFVKIFLILKYCTVS